MTDRYRIKQREVPQYRLQFLEKQGYRCAICGLPLTPEKAVLDHCHVNGHLRGALHSQCNGLLGKIENYQKRYGIPSLPHFLSGVDRYLSSTRFLQTPLHHTFKTSDEKKAAQAKRRATVRARKKAGGGGA